MSLRASALSVPAGILLVAGLLHCAPASPVATPPAPAPRTGADCGSMEDLLRAVNERVKTAAAGRRLRLAVIPLRATESPRWRDKGFGSYATERLCSSLGSPDSPVRLFERERLDAVLQEQKLSLSGLFNEQEARRIGELAPLDAILTGTFTRLEGCAVFNLRIIDVVTGEVRGNLSLGVALGPDLGSLFEDPQAPRPLPTAPAPGQARAEEDCEPRWEPVRAALKDMGTKSKLDHLVEEAARIPFEGACGRIHFDVIGQLQRYKLAAPDYDAFLVRTLQGMDSPDEDDRAHTIARRLLAQGQLDEPGWKALARLAAHSRHSSYLMDSLLADTRGTEASRKVLQDRITRLLDQADQGKFGRPVPLAGPELFTQILGSLQHDFLGSYTSTRRDPRPLLEAWLAHGARYAADSDRRQLEILVALHDSCEPGPDQARVLGWIADRINAFTPSADLERTLVPFLEKLIQARAKSQGAGGPAAGELKVLGARCGERIRATIPFIVGRDYTLDLQGFCLENGLEDGAVVPRLETLVQRLGGENGTERTEAIRLLGWMGPRALPAEPAALKLLLRSQRLGDSLSRDIYLQHDLVVLFGGMGTRNPETLQALAHHLDDLDSYVADVAVEALARLGEPAVPVLKAAFPRLEQPYKQMRVVKVFRLRGHGARAHLPWLKARLEEAKSPFVKGALEDAIETIQ